MNSSEFNLFIPPIVCVCIVECLNRKMFLVLETRHLVHPPCTFYVPGVSGTFYVPNVLLPFVSFLSRLVSCLLGVYFDLFYLLEFLIESKASLNYS